MRLLRAAILTVMAGLGLLAAHVLDYALVVPDPAHRHDLLLRSGHGYLSRAFAVAVAAAAVAAVAGAALGFVGGSRSHGVRRVAGLLALIQTGGFVVLESVERLLVGLPADRMFLVVVLVGSMLQLATATVSALLLRLFERVGRAIAALVSGSPRPSARAPRRPVRLTFGKVGRNPLASRSRSPPARVAV